MNKKITIFIQAQGVSRELPENVFCSKKKGFRTKVKALSFVAFQAKFDQFLLIFLNLSEYRGLKLFFGK